MVYLNVWGAAELIEPKARKRKRESASEVAWTQWTVGARRNVYY
jgi:hypothetical protein